MTKIAKPLSVNSLTRLPTLGGMTAQKTSGAGVNPNGDPTRGFVPTVAPADNTPAFISNTELPPEWVAPAPIAQVPIKPSQYTENVGKYDASTSPWYLQAQQNVDTYKKQIADSKAALFAQFAARARGAAAQAATMGSGFGALAADRMQQAAIQNQEAQSNFDLDSLQGLTGLNKSIADNLFAGEEGHLERGNRLTMAGRAVEDNASAAYANYLYNNDLTSKDLSFKAYTAKLDAANRARTDYDQRLHDMRMKEIELAALPKAPGAAPPPTAENAEHWKNAYLQNAFEDVKVSGGTKYVNSGLAPGGAALGSSVYNTSQTSGRRVAGDQETPKLGDTFKVTVSRGKNKKEINLPKQFISDVKKNIPIQYQQLAAELAAKNVFLSNGKYPSMDELKGLLIGSGSGYGASPIQQIQRRAP